MAIRSVSDYALTDLGPTSPGRGNREVVPYYSSERSSAYTASYVPNAILKNKKQDLKKPVDDCIQHHKVTERLIQTLKPDIENHFERRIQLFAQQTLLLYKTGYSCSDGKAYLQFGKGHTEKGHKYAAAHNATLPSIVCEKDDVSVYFAKGTDLYDSWNETTLLPTTVNEMDTRIDLHNRKMGVDKALREVSIEILNEVADADEPATPVQGLKTFLTKALGILTSAKNAAEEANEKRILGYYMAPIRDYCKFLNRGEPVVQKLCLVPITTELNASFFQDIQLYMYKRLIKPTDTSDLVQRLFAAQSIPRTLTLPAPQEQ